MLGKFVLSMLVLSLPGSGGSLDNKCSPFEYEGPWGCCPKCLPGFHVSSHCSEHATTTCAPCPQSTYTEAPNGWTSCKTCTHCDSNSRVRVKKNCSSTSDTLCEPLEGHYCTDPIKDGCQGAVEHTKCKPGQYIKQKGTASSDTVCNDCGHSTYSDGSLPSCRPHTQCEQVDTLRKPGTSSSDVECQSYGAIILGYAISFIWFSAFLLLMLCPVILMDIRRCYERAMKCWSYCRAGEALKPPVI